MIGSTVLHYRIVDLLGQGGMGVVYKAIDTRLDTFRAIKFLHPAHEEGSLAYQQLIREARTQAQLNHPNIAQLLAVEQFDRGAFLVLEYVEGLSLGDYLLDTKLAFEDKLHIILQIAHAIGTAHSLNIIHRDIKPANILVTPSKQVKITDFGLAKGKDQTTLTTDGITKGTVLYMPPEVFRGERSTKASDVWAFGALTHEMFQGKHPFQADSYEAIVYRILNDSPVQLSKQLQEQCSELQNFLDCCLTKEPTKRLQDGIVLFRELEKIALKQGINYSGTVSSFAVIKRRSRKLLRNSAIWLMGGLLTLTALFLILQRGPQIPFPDITLLPAYSDEDFTSWDSSGERFAHTTKHGSGLIIRNVSAGGIEPETPIFPDSIRVTYVKWSPNGAHMLIRSSDRLYINDINSGNLEYLLSTSALYPSWSLDNQWILIAESSATESRIHRYKLAPNASGPAMFAVEAIEIPISSSTILPDNAQYYNPISILDDQFLAFVAVDNKGIHLGCFVVPIEGGTPRIIIPGLNQPWLLDWDHLRNVMLYRKQYQQDIYWIELNEDGEPVRAEQSLGLQYEPDHFDFHPATGNLAIVTSYSQSHMWRAPIRQENVSFERFMDTFPLINSPSVSANNQNIFFSADSYSDSGMQIYKYHLPADSLSLLHGEHQDFSAEYFPLPSPTNERFTLFLGCRIDQFGLFCHDLQRGLINLIEADQSDSIRVHTPSWSLDGKAIYYVEKHLDGTPDYIIKLTVRETTRGLVKTGKDTCHSGMNLSHPIPSSDGRFILFQQQQEDNLYKIHLLDPLTAVVDLLTEGFKPSVDRDYQDLYYLTQSGMFLINDWAQLPVESTPIKIGPMPPNSVLGGLGRAIALSEYSIYVVFQEENIGTIGWFHIPPNTFSKKRR